MHDLVWWHISSSDMASVTLAAASVAGVLGGLFGWLINRLLRNEHRIATLEKGQEIGEQAQSRLEGKLDSLHERLDAYFSGKGARP